jgi:hypothetical protein
VLAPGGHGSGPPVLADGGEAAVERAPRRAPGASARGRSPALQVQLAPQPGQWRLFLSIYL